MTLVKPDGERIAQLEAHLGDFEKTSNQGLQRLELSIKDLSLEIKDFRNMTTEKYVTKEEFKTEIAEIKKAIETREKVTWVTHTVTALITAVLSILLTLYFTGKI